VGITGPTVNIFILGSASTTLSALAVPNSGSYDLFFPTSLEPANNYLALIVSTQDGTVSDTSPPFEIVPNNTASTLPWQLME